MNILSNAERRSARMTAAEGTPIISAKSYNLIMCGTVLFGLILNVLMCYFCTGLALSINPLALIIGYVVFAIAGTVIAYRSAKPVVSFIGYCMVVIPLGLVIAVSVYSYGGIDSAIVMNAFLLTGIITLVMTLLATLVPWFFSGIGQYLLTVLIGLIVCEVVCLLLGMSNYIFSLIAAGVFSLYIGFDVYRSQSCAKTVDNAIDCALDIYLDIVNLFLRLLASSSRNGGSSGGSGRK